MPGPIFLGDKSALARLNKPDVERRVGPLLLAGKVARCGVSTLEILFSARTHRDFVQTRAELDAMPHVDITQADFDRAIEVMELLARRGKHRAAALPDLLTAALAERARLCVLHYDKDFELIAAVTGQRTEWVVARGTVP